MRTATDKHPVDAGTPRNRGKTGVMRNSLNAAFVPIRRAASALGVPLAWLKREAEAGRVPAVRAGRRWFVHLDRAHAQLADRAASGAETTEGGVA